MPPARQHAGCHGDTFPLSIAGFVQALFIYTHPPPFSEAFPAEKRKALTKQQEIPIAPFYRMGMEYLQFQRLRRKAKIPFLSPSGK